MGGGKQWGRDAGVGVGGRIRDLISLCDLDILLLPPSAKAAAAARSKPVRGDVIEREIHIIFCQTILVTVDLEGKKKQPSLSIYQHRGMTVLSQLGLNDCYSMTLSSSPLSFLWVWRRALEPGKSKDEKKNSQDRDKGKQREGAEEVSQINWFC